MCMKAIEMEEMVFLKGLIYLPFCMMHKILLMIFHECSLSSRLSQSLRDLQSESEEGQQQYMFSVDQADLIKSLSTQTFETIAVTS